MIGSRTLSRLAGPFTDLVRWGEPWDVEDEPDPLLGCSLDPFDAPERPAVIDLS